MPYNDYNSLQREWHSKGFELPKPGKNEFLNKLCESMFKPLLKPLSGLSEQQAAAQTLRRSFSRAERKEIIIHEQQRWVYYDKQKNEPAEARRLREGATAIFGEAHRYEGEALLALQQLDPTVKTEEINKEIARLKAEQNKQAGDTAAFEDLKEQIEDLQAFLALLPKMREELEKEVKDFTTEQVCADLNATSLKKSVKNTEIDTGWEESKKKKAVNKGKRLSTAQKDQKNTHTLEVNGHVGGIFGTRKMSIRKEVSFEDDPNNPGKKIKVLTFVSPEAYFTRNLYRYYGFPNVQLNHTDRRAWIEYVYSQDLMEKATENRIKYTRDTGEPDSEDEVAFKIVLLGEYLEYSIEQSEAQLRLAKDPSHPGFETHVMTGDAEIKRLEDAIGTSVSSSQEAEIKRLKDLSARAHVLKVQLAGEELAECDRSNIAKTSPSYKACVSAKNAAIAAKDLAVTARNNLAQTLENLVKLSLNVSSNEVDKNAVAKSADAIEQLTSSLTQAQTAYETARTVMEKARAEYNHQKGMPGSNSSALRSAEIALKEAEDKVNELNIDLTTGYETLAQLTAISSATLPFGGGLSDHDVITASINPANVNEIIPAIAPAVAAEPNAVEAMAEILVKARVPEITDPAVREVELQRIRDRLADRADASIVLSEALAADAAETMKVLNQVYRTVIDPTATSKTKARVVTQVAAQREAIVRAHPDAFVAIVRNNIDRQREIIAASPAIFAARAHAYAEADAAVKKRAFATLSPATFAARAHAYAEADAAVKKRAFATLSSATFAARAHAYAEADAAERKRAFVVASPESFIANVLDQEESCLAVIMANPEIFAATLQENNEACRVMASILEDICANPEQKEVLFGEEENPDYQQYVTENTEEVLKLCIQKYPKQVYEIIRDNMTAQQRNVTFRVAIVTSEAAQDVAVAVADEATYEAAIEANDDGKDAAVAVADEATYQAVIEANNDGKDAAVAVADVATYQAVIEANDDGKDAAMAVADDATFVVAVQRSPLAMNAMILAVTEQVEDDPEVVNTVIEGLIPGGTIDAQVNAALKAANPVSLAAHAAIEKIAPFVAADDAAVNALANILLKKETDAPGMVINRVIRLNELRAELRNHPDTSIDRITEALAACDGAAVAALRPVHKKLLAANADPDVNFLAVINTPPLEGHARSIRMLAGVAGAEAANIPATADDIREARKRHPAKTKEIIRQAFEVVNPELMSTAMTTDVEAQKRIQKRAENSHHAIQQASGKIQVDEGASVDIEDSTKKLNAANAADASPAMILTIQCVTEALTKLNNDPATLPAVRHAMAAASPESQEIIDIIVADARLANGVPPDAAAVARVNDIANSLVAAGLADDGDAAKMILRDPVQAAKILKKTSHANRLLIMAQLPPASLDNAVKVAIRDNPIAVFESAKIADANAVNARMNAAIAAIPEAEICRLAKLDMNICAALYGKNDLLAADKDAMAVLVPNPPAGGATPEARKLTALALFTANGLAPEVAKEQRLATLQAAVAAHGDAAHRAMEAMIARPGNLDLVKATVKVEIFGYSDLVLVPIGPVPILKAIEKDSTIVAIRDASVANDTRVIDAESVLQQTKKTAQAKTHKRVLDAAVVVARAEAKKLIQTDKSLRTAAKEAKSEEGCKKLAEILKQNAAVRAIFLAVPAPLSIAGIAAPAIQAEIEKALENATTQQMSQAIFVIATSDNPKVHQAFAGDNEITLQIATLIKRIDAITNAVINDPDVCQEMAGLLAVSGNAALKREFEAGFGVALPSMTIDAVKAIITSPANAAAVRKGIGRCLTSQVQAVRDAIANAPGGKIVGAMPEVAEAAKDVNFETVESKIEALSRDSKVILAMDVTPLAIRRNPSVLSMQEAILANPETRKVMAEIICAALPNAARNEFVRIFPKINPNDKAAVEKALTPLSSVGRTLGYTDPQGVLIPAVLNQMAADDRFVAAVMLDNAAKDPKSPMKDTSVAELAEAIERHRNYKNAESALETMRHTVFTETVAAAPGVVARDDITRMTTLSATHAQLTQAVKKNQDRIQPLVDNLMQGKLAAGEIDTRLDGKAGVRVKLNNGSSVDLNEKETREAIHKALDEINERLLTRLNATTDVTKIADACVKDSGDSLGRIKATLAQVEALLPSKPGEEPEDVKHARALLLTLQKNSTSPLGQLINDAALAQAEADEKNAQDEVTTLTSAYQAELKTAENNITNARDLAYERIKAGSPYNVVLTAIRNLEDMNFESTLDAMFENADARKAMAGAILGATAAQKAMAKGIIDSGNRAAIAGLIPGVAVPADQDEVAEILAGLTVAKMTVLLENANIQAVVTGSQSLRTALANNSKVLASVPAVAAAITADPMVGRAAAVVNRMEAARNREKTRILAGTSTTTKIPEAILQARTDAGATIRNRNPAVAVAIFNDPAAKAILLAPPYAVANNLPAFQQFFSAGVPAVDRATDVQLAEIAKKREMLDVQAGVKKAINDSINVAMLNQSSEVQEILKSAVDGDGAVQEKLALVKKAEAKVEVVQERRESIKAVRTEIDERLEKTLADQMREIEKAKKQKKELEEKAAAIKQAKAENASLKPA